MSTVYYKAVRPDGTDFYSATVQWAPPPEGHDGPWIVRHPTAKRLRLLTRDNAADYLSVATAPTDCTGMRWPCRLIEMVPAGRSRVHDPGGPYPNKRVGLRFQFIREIDPHVALGPQGVHVAAFIEGIPAAWAAARAAAGAAAGDAAWAAARDAARVAAWAAAGVAAWAAARIAAWAAARVAAWAAARDAARALIVRDLLAPNHYDTLTRPWRTHVGRIHPDDADLRVVTS